MFKKMRFNYDRQGNYLKDDKGYENPRVLLASQVNANYFSFRDHEIRCHRFTVPSILIYRNYKKLENDPYNDDGKSATSCMNIIVNAHVYHGGTYVEIYGLELPNICWAGDMTLPCNGKPRKGVSYLDMEVDRSIEKLKTQWITLS